MKKFYTQALLLLLLFPCVALHAQTIVKGRILDSLTGQPIAAASIHCLDRDCNAGTMTNALGEFHLQCITCRKLLVTSIGYAAREIFATGDQQLVYMNTVSSPLQELIFTASRGEAMKRSSAPVAIGTISSKMLQETRPTSVDQVLNKISGVNMVNLGNEQHQMSIRQPMTTKSLFLYLEDGIPIRTTGLYNHNALLEMNMPAVKQIEIIKGPASSLYGAEAIGGAVNIITQAPPAIFTGQVSAQITNTGYKRTDVQVGNTFGKFGLLI